MSFESISREKNNAGPRNERQAYIEMGGSFNTVDKPIEYEPGNVYESLRDNATREATRIPNEMIADPTTTFASAERVIAVPEYVVHTDPKIATKAEKSFMDKVRGWFGIGREVAQDKTFSERLAEEEAQEAEIILESVRGRLVSDPASLTAQEVAMLSNEEMAQFVRWKTRQSHQANLVE